MSVPSFADLGKNVREVLNTGYRCGKRLVLLNMKNSRKDFEIGSIYAMDHSDSYMHGQSTAKLKLRDYGIISENWDTDGKLNLKLSYNKLLEGLDITGEIMYQPTTDIATIKCGANFQNEYVNVDSNISNNFDIKYINLCAEAVVALKDALLGYKVGYDTALGSLTKSEIGLSYKFPNLGINFNCSPGFTDDFEVSTVMKVTDTFEAALSAGCVASNSIPINDNALTHGIFNEIVGEWIGTIGGRYQVNNDTVVKAKVDSNLQLSASLMVPVAEGVQVTSVVAFDLDDPLGGGQKFGITIDINA